jgi:hypothetical protein
MLKGMRSCRGEAAVSLACLTEFVKDQTFRMLLT